MNELYNPRNTTSAVPSSVPQASQVPHDPPNLVQDDQLRLDPPNDNSDDLQLRSYKNYESEFNNQNDLYGQDSQVLVQEPPSQHQKKEEQQVESIQENLLKTKRIKKAKMKDLIPKYHRCLKKMLETHRNRYGAQYNKCKKIQKKGMSMANLHQILYPSSNRASLQKAHHLRKDFHEALRKEIPQCKQESQIIPQMVTMKIFTLRIFNRELATRTQGQ